MANFAQLNEDNIVINIVIVKDDILFDNGIIDENKGIEFLRSVTNHLNWRLTTSQNRKQPAQIDFFYNHQADVFIAPQPFPSWSLDADFDWQPPKPKPEGFYYWDEEEGDWINGETL